MSEGQAASTHPRIGKQIKAYEATPTHQDPTTSKINLNHEWGTSYVLVFPQNRRTLAAIAFEGMKSTAAKDDGKKLELDWNSISDQIDNMGLLAGYRLLLVTTTVNSLTLQSNFNRMGENKILARCWIYKVEGNPPKNGHPAAFKLPEHGNELHMVFSDLHHKIPTT